MPCRNLFYQGRTGEPYQEGSQVRESFCRHLLNGAEIKEAPSADVPMLINEVRRVGYNIDQILRMANARGMLDVPKLREALTENRKVEKMITAAYTMPED